MTEPPAPTEASPAPEAGRLPTPPAWLAAVDMGSNSFHMIVAQMKDGQLHIVDRLREAVRLAMGLDEKGRLSRKAQDRAFRALERFGQRVRHFRPGTVRAVGTNTLRRAKESEVFLKRARKLLGHDIEVISGQEEARLIYIGVCHDVQPPRGTRLVVDIGGGSTEIIHGEGLDMIRADSLYMGCASFSQRYFPKGRIRKKAMAKARTAARLELEPIRGELKGAAWEHALGASGTVRAVAKLAKARGFTTTGITASAMQDVLDLLVDAGDVDTLSNDEVSAARKPVFAAGAAILGAIIEDLEIDRLQVADGALREGALYDLLGRFQHEDVRNATVDSFMRRYGVDAEQAARVENAALDLLEQVFADWELKGSDAKSMLCWASRLHEIGMSVAHSGYHRHGAYLINNANMAGFSRGEQAVLATLVLSHRRKLRRGAFQHLPPARRRSALRLAVLLRLAVRLHRSRSPDALPPVRIDVRDDEIELSLPKGWLENHALTRADLDVEAERLANAGFYLSYR
ncbi:MAG: Ppx/GppA phosphatase family protein [Planctomycetota bacterium]|nr:Ppx/GppA phosphatase family protein [Planctomycetota bacterium]